MASLRRSRILEQSKRRIKREIWGGRAASSGTEGVIIHYLDCRRAAISRQFLGDWGGGS